MLQRIDQHVRWRLRQACAAHVAAEISPQVRGLEERIGLLESLVGETLLELEEMRQANELKQGD
jgi:hypothetical protein